MGKKLLIMNFKQWILTALYEGKELIQVNLEYPDQESILGNIYLGKVKNIVTNLNAAFVEITNKKMCYLSLEDCKNPIFANNNSSGRIREGDELIVQVNKEQQKTKAPGVTVNFNLTGKYIVLVHGQSGVGVSNKITEEKRRRQLKTIILPFQDSRYSFIVRTNAWNAEEKELIEEIAILKDIYEKITSYGVHHTCYSLLHSTLPAYLCAIRDGFAEDIEEIITDNQNLYQQIQDYLVQFQKEDINKLRLYIDPILSLDKLYSVETRLTQAFSKQVWLKCGGTIIIEPTEALIVIDVNSGKAVTGRKKVQDTFRKVNLEAAEEIAKQIRLRNLSGIIIVDFIDMELEEYKTELIDLFRRFLSNDPIKTVLVDMTALNLIEITRKKVRKPLHEL